ncbi:MAG: tetratricopeptide repeat protein [Gammaproteobacteria bacterium]|nr:tetratricopeptide repeat protein [Gammaproteobacteria bacterium]
MIAGIAELIHACRFAAAGLLLASLLGACAPGVPTSELPTLPPVSTDSFLPAVAGQLGALTEAVIADPRSAGKAGRLGMAYLAYRQDYVAEAALRRAVLLQPRSFEWQYYHAEALTRLGRLQEAVESLEQAQARNPDYPRTRTRLGLLHLQLGDLEAARIYLSEAVAANAGNAEARLGLARLLLREGELDAALAQLNTLDKQLGGADSVYFALAEAWRRKGDKGKAQRYLALFESGQGTGVPVRDPLMNEVLVLDMSEKPLLRLAGRLNRQGRPMEAIAALNRALERNPGSHLTHAALVGAYGALRQFDRAEEHYRLALEAAPATAPLLRNLARARFYQGRLEASRMALEEALAIDPHDAKALMWLGRVYLAEDRTDQGIEMLAKAVEKDPTETLARNLLIETLLEANRHEEAFANLRALQTPERKHSPQAWRTMGQAYMKLGDTELARDALAAAVASAERLGDATEARRSASLLEGLSQ